MGEKRLDSSTIPLRAAFLRIVLGVLALTLVPAAAPRILSLWWLLAAYLASAIVVQIMVWKHIGSQTPRALVQGIFDFGILTLVIQRLGSAPSPLAGLYIFVAMMYALVVERAVAVALSLFGATAYAAVLIAERLGWLPFAPDAPAWASQGAPSAELVGACIVLGYLLPVGSALIVSHLANALRAREQELVELSKRDALTQLYNRRHLVERLELELARGRRGHSLAVLMIDLDGFKRVNDAQGHLCGDRVLQELGAALHAAVRASDMVGRFGGDEFVVLLPDADLAQARLAGERLLACIRSVGREVGPGGPITASMGVVAALPEDDPSSVLRRADEVTYAAKRAGGDRLVATGA